MKMLPIAMLAAVIAMLAAAALAINVGAEDYSFEISEPAASSGEWDLAFVHETANAGNFPDNFNALWMTPASDVTVYYTYEGKASGAPLELIWQTWKGPVEPDPDVKKKWNKIAPYEYDETYAKFSFEDIAAAYGTADFSTVYAINIGDRGVKLTVTGVTVSNCDFGGYDPQSDVTSESVTETETETETETASETEILTETQTEMKTEKETSPPVTESASETDISPSEDIPEEEGGGAAVVVIVIVLFIIIAGMTAAAYLTRKRKKKSRYY